MTGLVNVDHLVGSLLGEKSEAISSSELRAMTAQLARDFGVTITKPDTFARADVVGAKAWHRFNQIASDLECCLCCTAMRRGYRGRLARAPPFPGAGDYMLLAPAAGALLIVVPDHHAYGPYLHVRRVGDGV